MRQVVVVAAGYDGRSFRYRQPGVVFFEIDHPDTQRDKLARLAVDARDLDDARFAPVDLAVGSLSEALADAGHDETAATHFMCEGFTPYVPRAVVAAALRSMADRAAPGSSLAIDFIARGTGVRRLQRRAMQSSTAMLGERMVDIVSASEVSSLLRDRAGRTPR